jgi:hypothetical protein
MVKSEFKNVFLNDAEHQEWLLKALRSGPVTVNFTKADGTERAMACTLDESMIPTEFAPKVKEEGAVERKKSTDAVAVFDLEKEGWRSFRWDAVKTVVIAG